MESCLTDRRKYQWFSLSVPSGECMYQRSLNLIWLRIQRSILIMITSLSYVELYRIFIIVLTKYNIDYNWCDIFFKWSLPMNRNESFGILSWLIVFPWLFGILDFNENVFNCVNHILFCKMIMIQKKDNWKQEKLASAATLQKFDVKKR